MVPSVVSEISGVHLKCEGRERLCNVFSPYAYSELRKKEEHTPILALLDRIGVLFHFLNKQLAILIFIKLYSNYTKVTISLDASMIIFQQFTSFLTAKSHRPIYFPTPKSSF